MLKDDPCVILLLFLCLLLMSRDWGWGVHDPLRRQVLSLGMGSGPSGGSCTHPPLPLQTLMILVQMFYDDWCMDVGKGMGVRGVWSVEKAGTLPLNGIGPQWGIRPSSPPPPFNMGVNVDLDPIFCDDYFMDVLRGLGLRDAWYTEKADTLPVNGIGPQWWITHSSSPPFTLSPRTFLKLNTLVTICLRYGSLSVSMPSLRLMLHWFSLWFFSCMCFFLNVIIQLKNLVNRGAQLKQPQAIESACCGK